MRRPEPVSASSPSSQATGATSLWVGDNGNSGQNLIIADNGGTDEMSLDNSGNLVIAGSLTQNGTPLISTPAGGPQIESVGDGQLSNGSANVTIDPAFAKHLDTSRTYHVFLTPNGDSNGLYVTGKTQHGIHRAREPPRHVLDRVRLPHRRYATPHRSRQLDPGSFAPAAPGSAHSLIAPI